MFFIFGIAPKIVPLNYIGDLQVHTCGKFGRYEVFRQQTTLSIFFIPIFSWKKEYFVKSTCCERTYQLSQEIGRKIEAVENPIITEDMLTPLFRDSGYITCPHCGYLCDPEFTYCPSCGKPLDN